MRAIELFKTITKIPRCSGTHQPFIDFLKEFSSKNSYICKIDSANNILCYKNNQKPNICLQSHYDIVCLQDGTIPEIIEVDGYLKAKNSTLGADNGIGCAYMLALMEEDTDAEFLFTCDEEIGLIGANNIEHTLQSSYMLNLDSEAEAEICIGCAGGVDIFGLNNTSEYIQNSKNKTLYEITIDNLDGGHSGVDIDKNIPNALKLIAKTIKESKADLLDINGGERINSIAKKAKAIVAVSSNIEPIKSHKNMIITKINTKTEHFKKLDPRIIDFLYTFANGVRGYDKEVEVVLSSINLAIITNSVDGVKIELSARSMDNNELKILKDETIALLKIFGFEVTTDGKYPAWKPEHSSFTNEVFKIYKEHISDTTINAIHAGLECAIFKEKYPNIQVCSIGPNIYFPHSFREKCEISSVIKLYQIVKQIVNTIK
ncbi:MAG: M20/M25/M40 family metallo-hydrolase [Campylobacterota bacterium]|nr:M20/M25/M40 family metallo-hydrolase [Campylobacterota bacterium]